MSEIPNMQSFKRCDCTLFKVSNTLLWGVYIRKVTIVNQISTPTLLLRFVVWVSACPPPPCMFVCVCVWQSWLKSIYFTWFPNTAYTFCQTPSREHLVSRPPRPPFLIWRLLVIKAFEGGGRQWELLTTGFLSSCCLLWRVVQGRGRLFDLSRWLGFTNKWFHFS